MPKVQVWNKNVHVYKETFKGDKVEIAPNSFIWMDEDEAYQFMGTFSPPVLDVDGNHKPEGYKMIRVVIADNAPAESKPKSIENDNICVACRYQASDSKDLEEHSKVSHASSLLKDELAELELKKRKTG